MWLPYSCPPTHSPSGGEKTDLHGSPLPKNAELLRCDARQSLEMKLRKFGRCLPAYYSILFPKEYDFTAIARYLLWIPKDRETVLLAYYRLEAHLDSMGRARRTAKQLCKHRLVPRSGVPDYRCQCAEKCCDKGLRYDLSTLGTT